jgi:hypothetical protein
VGKFYNNILGVLLVVEYLKVRVIFVEEQRKLIHHCFRFNRFNAPLILWQVQFIHDPLYQFFSRRPKLSDMLDETLTDLQVPLLVANRLNQLVKRVLVLHIPALLFELLKIRLHLRLTTVVLVDDPLDLVLALLGHRLLWSNVLLIYILPVGINFNFIPYPEFIR